MRNRKTAGKATLKARRNESKGMLKSKGKSPYSDRSMSHRARKTNSAKATNMFAKILNRTRKAPKAKAGARPTRARMVRKNKGVARKTTSAKAATAAAAKARAVKARANKRMRPGSAVALLRRLVNAPARKKRSNKGKTRVMIASPGGSVYKGMAALTRAMRKRNM